jgi:hypothetical protein
VKTRHGELSIELTTQTGPRVKFNDRRPAR